MTKRTLNNGLKARQRNDSEDRAFHFREDARKYGLNARDVDLISDKYIFAHTKGDSKKAIDNAKYRSAIDARRQRDGDDAFEIYLAGKLNRTAIIVLSSDDSDFYWVRKASKPGQWYEYHKEVFFDKVK